MRTKSKAFDNGCWSSGCDAAILIDPNGIAEGHGCDKIPELLEPRDGEGVLELRERCGHLIAVPVFDEESHPGGAGPMFGGTFCYTSDSRFPEHRPIPIHDRWEGTRMDRERLELQG